MSKVLHPISFGFSPEMLEKMEERALVLGLSRSAYLRQLVADDLLKAGGMESQGNQSVHERVRNLENEIRFQGTELKSLRGEIAALREALGAQPFGSLVLPKVVSEETTDQSTVDQRKPSKKKRSLRSKAEIQTQTPSDQDSALNDLLDHISPPRSIDTTGGDGL